MMRMMHDARFEKVFLGIETPMAEPQAAQGAEHVIPDAAVDRITANGIGVMAGFVGFDGEKDGAGQRIVEFVTRTGIPAAMMGMLRAPKTAPARRTGRSPDSGRCRQGREPPTCSISSRRGRSATSPTNTWRPLRAI